MSDVTVLADGTRIIWAPLERTKRISITQVIGELLITFGVIIGLFVGYKVLFQDNVVGANQNELANTFTASGPKFVPVEKVHTLAQIFGRMYVPRFGSSWTRLIGEGTRWHPVLNEIGVGHYTNTVMPGEVGNFSVAAHRGGFGGAFKLIHELKAGDRVYVETNESWYVYKYLATKIVLPEDVSVIDPVPQELTGAVSGGKYMTMTSCTPIFVNSHRIVVWLELESVIPSDGNKPPLLNYELKGN